MGYSTSNPNKVGFSKGAEVFIGAVSAPLAQCDPVGLLGQDVTLSMEKTFRTKNDHFPQVEVASAVASLSMTSNMVLREWTKENLMRALDVGASDVTDVTATPVNVVDEAHTMPASGQLAITIPRTGLSNIVVKEAPSTTLTLNTDYVVVVTPRTTMIVALSGGDIAASDDLLISYDYTPLAHSVMPMGTSGKRNEYGLWITEDYTMSSTSKVEFQLYRVNIGLNGSFNINNAENGADLPITVQALLPVGGTELGQLYTYE